VEPRTKNGDGHGVGLEEVMQRAVTNVTYNGKVVHKMGLLQKEGKMSSLFKLAQAPDGPWRAVCPAAFRTLNIGNSTDHCRRGIVRLWHARCNACKPFDGCIPSRKRDGYHVSLFARVVRHLTPCACTALGRPDGRLPVLLERRG
jgi:hypothetical protein